MRETLATMATRRLGRAHHEFRFGTRELVVLGGVRLPDRRPRLFRRCRGRARDHARPGPGPRGSRARPSTRRCRGGETRRGVRHRGHARGRRKSPSTARSPLRRRTCHSSGNRRSRSGWFPRTSRPRPPRSRPYRRSLGSRRPRPRRWWVVAIKLVLSSFPGGWQTPPLGPEGARALSRVWRRRHLVRGGMWRKGRSGCRLPDPGRADF